MLDEQGGKSTREKTITHPQPNTELIIAEIILNGLRTFVTEMICFVCLFFYCFFKFISFFLPYYTEVRL